MTTSRAPSLRLDTLVAQAREPAFVLGPDRRFLGVNRAFEDLTGQTADRLIGLLCQSQGTGRTDELTDLASAFSPPWEAIAGQPCACAIRIVHPGGEHRTRRASYWPFQDADGRFLGLFGIVQMPDDSPVISNAESRRPRDDLLGLRVRLEQRHGFDSLLGQGPAHRRLLDQVRIAASSDLSVLIVGETGTGKRTVARTIHSLGPRRQSPLFPFDVAALPPDVLDRELFGDADESSSTRPRLALPDESTVVLGDVLNLPRDLQAKLAASADGRVRIIGTTSGDIDSAFASDRIRPDFYFAMTSLVLRLQPLRERLHDLPILAQNFLDRTGRRRGRRIEEIAPDALDVLAAYDWPGNLRELDRVLDAAIASCPVSRLGIDDIPIGIRGSMGAAYLPPPLPEPRPLDDLLTEVERRLIEQSLINARRNKSRAAEILGISRPRLYRRIKELGIPDENESPDDDRSLSQDART